MGAQPDYKGYLLFSPLLIAVFAALIMLPSAQAFTSLDLSDARCSEDGSLSLTIKNFGDTELNTSDIMLNVSPAGSPPTSLTGSFGRTSLYPGSTYTMNTEYTSDTGNLNTSGTYTITADYIGCRHAPCTVTATAQRCPGFSYQCRLADVQIDRCFMRNGALQIYFSGINKKQYERINPLSEITVGLRSNSRTLQSAYYPAGAAVKQTGNDEYILSIPLLSGERVSEVSIELPRCSDPPTLREIDICQVSAAPTDEDDKASVPVKSTASVSDATSADETDPLSPAPTENPTKISDTRSEDGSGSPSPSSESSLLSSVLVGTLIALWLGAIVLVGVLLARQLKK